MTRCCNVCMMVWTRLSSLSTTSQSQSKRVEDLEKFNEEEGLALSPEEIEYLHKIEKQNGRPLTDSEIFGFAQINSEHCRHKIFGGEFIIDGKVMESSLFSLIKKTTKENPGKILSAYKDNVAFAQGPEVEQFAPANQSTSDFFRVKPIESVISLKAETHNSQLPLSHSMGLQQAQVVRYVTVWAVVSARGLSQEQQSI